MEKSKVIKRGVIGSIITPELKYYTGVEKIFLYPKRIIYREEFRATPLTIFGPIYYNTSFGPEYLGNILTFFKGDTSLNTILKKEEKDEKIIFELVGFYHKQKFISANELEFTDYELEIKLNDRTFNTRCNLPKLEDIEEKIGLCRKTAEKLIRHITRVITSVYKASL